MVHETSIIGLIGFVIAISIYLKTADVAIPIIIIILAIAMMIFGRNENEIEKRKDG